MPPSPALRAPSSPSVAPPERPIAARPARSPSRGRGTPTKSPAAQPPNLSPPLKPAVYSPYLLARKRGRDERFGGERSGGGGVVPFRAACRMAWRPKRAPLPARSCPESNLLTRARAQSDASGAGAIVRPKILVGRRGESLTHTCGLTAPGPSPRRPASIASTGGPHETRGLATGRFRAPLFPNSPPFGHSPHGLLALHVSTGDMHRLRRPASKSRLPPLSLPSNLLV